MSIKKILKIDYLYNKPIQNLPDSIEYLIFYGNSKIINLPANLKQINLFYNYKYFYSFKFSNLFSKFKIITD